jgi:hypothetical protein
MLGGGGGMLSRMSVLQKNSLDRSKTDQAGLKTGQICCPQGFGYKAKSKMMKPKKPEVNVWKSNEAKCYEHRKVKKSKPQKFQAKSQSRIVTNILASLKILNMRSHLMIRIGNGIIMIHQCRFHRIGHIIIHHGGLIMIYLIFIHHGLQGCYLLQYTFI